MGDPGPEAGVMAAMTQEFLVEPQPSHKYKCVPVVESVHSVQDHAAPAPRSSDAQPAAQKVPIFIVLSTSRSSSSLTPRLRQ